MACRQLDIQENDLCPDSMLKENYQMITHQDFKHPADCAQARQMKVTDFKHHFIMWIAEVISQ